MLCSDLLQKHWDSYRPTQLVFLGHISLHLSLSRKFSSQIQPNSKCKYVFLQVTKCNVTQAHVYLTEFCIEKYITPQEKLSKYFLYKALSHRIGKLLYYGYII